MVPEQPTFHKSATRTSRPSGQLIPCNRHANARTRLPGRPAGQPSPDGREMNRALVEMNQSDAAGVAGRLVALPEAIAG